MKERERQSQKDLLDKDEEQKQKKQQPLFKEKRKKREVEGINSANTTAATFSQTPIHNNTHFEGVDFEKPDLPLPEIPRLSLFSLYFMLDKVRIQSEGADYALSREEIREIDEKLTVTHAERLEKLKKTMEKEKQVEKWDVALKTYALLGSIAGVISGVMLIASGAGAVAGALLIVAGVLSISTQIMELTGGWAQIAGLLPGDDTDAKRGVISWIQIGVAVFSIILALASAIYGGFMIVIKSFQFALSALEAIGIAGKSIATIGHGVTMYQFNYGLANVKEFDIAIEKLRIMRKNLMEIIEDIADRIEKMLEYFGEILTIQKEIFRAEQMAWR